MQSFNNKFVRLFAVGAIVISTVCTAMIGSADFSDREKFKHIQTAFRFWLQQKNLLDSKQVVQTETMNYLNLAPIALDGILTGSDKWQVEHIADYNPLTGMEVPPAYKSLVVEQNMNKKDVVVSGYYFISKGSKENGQHLIVQPTTQYYYSSVEGVWFDYTAVNIYYAENQKATADEFSNEVLSYIDGPRNPYRYQILEFGANYDDLYSDGFQLRFLDNVSELSAGWSDIIMDDGLRELSYQNTEDFLRRSDEFEKYSVGAKKGMILEGPPGTGKSYLGQVLMSSVLGGDLKKRATFILVTARHLKYAHSIKTLFQEAQRLAPAVIFIEDIDLLGVKQRSGSGETSATGREEILNEFLNGIDGVLDNKGILVVATTNKINQVDAALLRSERLGIHLHFGLPEFEERKQFFERFGKKGSVWAEDLQLEWLAARTEKLSGADIIEIIGIAKQIALIAESWSGDKLFLTKEHFVEAISRVRRNHGESGGRDYLHGLGLNHPDNVIEANDSADRDAPEMRSRPLSLVNALKKWNFVQ